MYCISGSLKFWPLCQILHVFHQLTPDLHMSLAQTRFIYVGSKFWPAERLRLRSRNTNLRNGHLPRRILSLSTNPSQPFKTLTDDCICFRKILKPTALRITTLKSELMQVNKVRALDGAMGYLRMHWTSGSRPHVYSGRGSCLQITLVHCFIVMM